MKWFVFIYRSLIVTIASIAWWEGLIKRNANARNFCVSYSSDCAFYRPTRNESLKAFIVSGVRWSVKLSQQTEAQKLHFCVRQWSLLTILRGCLYGNWKPAFCLVNIWLVYIFEASYSTVVTSVSEKSSVDQSELEKYVVSHCQT